MSTHHKRPNRGNGSCTQTMSDIVARSRPERTIGFVCDSIALFDRYFGQEYREELREIALDAVSKFGAGTQHERSECMLPVYRILGKYARTMDGPALYDSLHEKKLFERSAQFYVDYASVYLAEGDPTRAAQIITHAISIVGPGNPLLEQCRVRVEQEVANQRLAAVLEFVPSQPPPDARNGRPIAEIPDFIPSRPPPNVRLLDTRMTDLRTGALVGRTPPLQSEMQMQMLLLQQQQQQQQYMQPPPPFPGESSRNVLGPIQAPRGRDAAAAAAAARAAKAESDFPPLRTTSRAAPAAAAAAPTGEPVANDDQENVLPPPSAASFVLPTLSEAAPFSPDMISPSLAQRKPGMPNQFILEPVFSFTNATREKDAQ